MKKFIISLIFCCSTAFLTAQVGINETQPSDHAALHINGDGIKGLIIPVMDTVQRKTKASAKPLPNGLLVFDSKLNMFFYWNGTEWASLNPLQSIDGKLATLTLSDKSEVIIFENDVNVSGDINVSGEIIVDGKTTLKESVLINSTLTVNSKTNMKNSLEIDNALIVNGTINVGKNTIEAGTINARKISASDTINAKTINATDGFGITPIGGIIMWSGTTIPNGWALCDGTQSNGYTTPDLRGRFIVGYGIDGTGLPNNVWDNYTNPGNLSIKQTTQGTRGGEMKHTLIINEMPSHTHPIANITRADGGGTQTGARDWHENRTGTEINSGSAGSSQPHENRPPYYVLAFIMRVK